jgi:hypothetical protein
VRAVHLAHNIVRDARTLTKPREVQLLDLAALADVVNQIVGVAFATKKCHEPLPLPASRRSVGIVHYTVNRPAML